jgi:Zn-dependent protease
VSRGWIANAIFLLALGTHVATPEVGTARALAIAAAVVLGAAGSLLVHEAGHAIAAHHHGVRIERMVLTLNGAHVELANEPPTPRAAFWICAAGPFAALAVLMLVLVGIDVLGEPGKLASLAHLELHHATDVLAFDLLFVNACSVVLSVLPGLPLDGGGMLHAVLWHRSGDRVGALEVPTWLGQGIGAAFALGGLWALSSTILGALPLLFGAYVGLAANRGLGSRVKSGLLAGCDLSDGFTPEPALVPATMDAGTAAATYFPAPSPPPYLPTVDAEGRYLGLVHRRELLMAIDTGPPPAVGRLVTPPERDALAAVVAPAAPLDSAAILRALAREGVAVAVDERRRFHGLVTTASWRTALAEAARRRRVATRP